MCKFYNGKEITKENLIEMIKNTEGDNNSSLEPISELKLRLMSYIDYENKDEDLDYIVEKLKNTVSPNLESVENILIEGKFYVDEYLDHKKTEILEKAEINFGNLECEGKVVIATRNYNSNKFEYSVECKEAFINRIKNRFEQIIEEFEIKDEEDAEAFNNIDYDFVANIEFNNDDVMLYEYYNVKDYIRDAENYKYTYLINYVKGAENHTEDIIYIVHSNIEIDSDEEMSEYLEIKNEEIPKDFGVKWANHYFKNIEDYSEEELFAIHSTETNYNFVSVDVEDYLKKKFLNAKGKLVDLDNQIQKEIQDIHGITPDSIFQYDVTEMLEIGFCYEYSRNDGYNFEFEIIEDDELDIVEDELNIVVKIINIDTV